MKDFNCDGCLAMPMILDEIDFAVENGLPPQVEDKQEGGIDVSMPNSTAKADELKTQKSSVRVSRWMLIVGMLSLIYTVFHDYHSGSAIDGRLNSIDNTLIVVDNTLGQVNTKIGGRQAGLRIVTQTVAPQLYKALDDSLSFALTLPSPEAAKALATTQASLKQLRESQIPPDKSELDQSAVLLENVTLLHPEIGEGWAASGQLISYRSSNIAPQSGSLPNCFDAPYAPSPDRAPHGDLNVQYFRGCTFIIDDQAGYEKSKAFQQFIAQLPSHPETMAVVLNLENVHVVYRGGPLIGPLTTVFFKNCTFDFNLPTTPPDPGKHLIRALLTADLAKPTEVSFIPRG